MKDTTMLRTYNSTAITQFWRCSVVIENNNKCKNYIFFVVPGDGDAILGMADIELLNLLQINCNIIGTKKEEKGMTNNKNKRNTINVGSEQC